MSPWRSNAWLLAFGIALTGLASQGPDGLVVVARDIYGRLPMLAPVFRADHERQVRALLPVVATLGLGSLAAYALASRRSVAVWAWLVGVPSVASRRDRLRTSIVASVVVYSILVVPLRLGRDVLREWELSGLSDRDRRLRLYGVHSREPDYGPIEEFRRMSRGEGALLVVRRGQPTFDDVFLAAYLFPQRAFVRLLPECSPDVLPRLRAERPTADWVEWACGDGRFAPVAIGPQ
ncbi:MAG TPA: hypothetical protein VFM88_05300 [Vicinamibacteria bacterium]|nr:hypothetical protein [Vicinamibacteria bacterium]